MLNTATASLWHNEIIASRTFSEFLCKLPHSDTQLAQKLNVETSTIYRWRQNQRIPDIGTIVDLALAIDISPSDTQILIRKARQAFGDEKQDYELLKKLHREPIDKSSIDAEYECYADVIDRDFQTAMCRILVWRGLTQKQLAQLCGVGDYQISKWFSRKITPDTEQIATALKLPATIACALKKPV